MRALLASLLLLLPITAHAGAVTVQDNVLQHGTFREGCDLPMEQGRDYCACRSDIVVPRLLNIAQADALNDRFVTDAQDMLCKGGSVPAANVMMNEKVLSYKVLRDDRAVLSLALKRYEYPAGAAHGMSSTENVVIEKRTGDVLEHDELIATDMLDALNASIYDVLRRRPDSFIGAGKPEYAASRGDVNYQYISAEHCNECSIGLDAEGLFVQFALYSVAPYSSGEVVVRIPQEFVAHPAIRKLYAKVSDAR